VPGVQPTSLSICRKCSASLQAGSKNSLKMDDSLMCDKLAWVGFDRQTCARANITGHRGRSCMVTAGKTHQRGMAVITGRLYESQRRRNRVADAAAPSCRLALEEVEERLEDSMIFRMCFPGPAKNIFRVPHYR
jgi:hypothetical protein